MIIMDNVFDLIKRFPVEYAAENNLPVIWQEPLIAVAKADDPMFAELKTIIGPEHMLPTDWLGDAKSVVAFYIPFVEEIAKSNIDGEEPSLMWAKAYVDTNNMIASLKSKACEALSDAGYPSSSANVGWNYETDGIQSVWSQRSAAYIAGLGTFGINNMLITEKGCCGRYGSFITSMPIDPTERPTENYCLFKKNGTCAVCVKKCPAGAFSIDREHSIAVSGSQIELGGAAEYGVFFDREKCYNHIHNELQLDETYPTHDVCGKCDVGLPCSFKRP